MAHYLQAIRRPFADLSLLITFSFLSFFPVINLIILGYLLDIIAGPLGELPEPDQILRLFVRGARGFAIAITFFFLPAVVFFLFGGMSAFITFIISIPGLLYSLTVLACEKSIESALSLRTLALAYRFGYVSQLFLALVVTFSIMVFLLFIPLLGWVSVLFAPGVTLATLLGDLKEEV